MNHSTLHYISSTFNYGPGGMVLEGRNWTADLYRYGFNGMETDDETYGNNNAFDFGARIYDSRLGRWLSIDPVVRKYPNVSPYSYVLNNPILYLDIGGSDVGVSIEKDPSDVGGKITLSSTVYVTGVDCDNVVEQYKAVYTEWSNNNQNKGTYTDENGAEWEIEITMTFVVATAVDIDRIKKASQGAASENLMEIDLGEKRSHVEFLPGDIKQYQYIPLDNGYKDASSEYLLGMRYAKMEVGKTGHTAIHEVLHLYGLTDRYTDGYYEIVDATTGKFLYFSGTYSHPHAGYEDNVMGASQFFEMNLNQTQFNNLGIAVFKAQAVEDYENGAENTPNSFILSRDIPSVETQDSATESYTTEGLRHQNFKKASW